MVRKNKKYEPKKYIFHLINNEKIVIQKEDVINIYPEGDTTIIKTYINNNVNIITVMNKNILFEECILEPINNGD